MFIIFFSVFIFFLTVIENINISLIVLWIIAFWLLIYQIFNKKKNYNNLRFIKSNYLFILFWAFILALFSFILYNFRISWSPANAKIFIDTGVISKNVWQGKYIFDSQNQSYYLSSKKEYQDGDVLRLVGNFAQNKQETDSLSSSFLYSGFNQAKRLKMKDYAWLVYENNSVILSSWLINDQLALYNKTWDFNRTQALVAGMLFWDKSKFTKSDYQLFIDSWLVHLVAVSWWNIVMLVTFLTAVLFFVPFYIRLVLLLLAIVWYWVICGMDSSVLRAVLMWSLSLVALFWGRQTRVWRLLGISYILMLCLNPYFLVYDVGFLLSFSAVIWILRINGEEYILDQEDLQNNFVEKHQVRTILKPFVWIRENYLKPSLWATIWILPILMFFMWKINILGILGNLMVLPIVPIIMIGWLVLYILPQRLWIYLFWLLSKLVDWIFIVSNYITDHGLYLISENIWIKYILLSVYIFVVVWYFWIWTRQTISRQTKLVDTKNLT